MRGDPAQRLPETKREKENRTDGTDEPERTARRGGDPIC